MQVAEEALPTAAEGEEGHWRRYAHVDAEHPRCCTALELTRRLSRGGVDGGGVAVLVRLRHQAQRFVEILCVEDGEDGSEDLLARERGVLFNAEHCWTNEEALRWARATPVANHLGAGGDPFINEAMNAFTRLAADHWAE